ncbi:MAG: ATP synthase F1 subunit epsilon [Sandaracinaceae bacterium]
MAADQQRLTLEVATLTGLALSTEADSVEAPGSEGEFGVLPNHRPLLAALRAGVLHYELDGETHRAAVGSGFVEAGPTKVLVLTDNFALPGDVSAEEAERDLEEAEAKLAAFREAHVGPDFAQIRREIEWARARRSLARA